MRTPEQERLIVPLTEEEKIQKAKSRGYPNVEDCSWHAYIASVRCSVTGRVYVYRSYNPSFYYRQLLSALRSFRCPNRRMQYDFCEFGEETFSCELLEYMPYGDFINSKPLETHLEKWILKLNARDPRYGYNGPKKGRKPKWSS